MTLYVSRHARHVIEIWPGLQEMVNVNGSPKMVDRMKILNAEFQPRRLTELQRKAAAAHFNMIPYGRELIMLPNSGDLGAGREGTPELGWVPGYSADAAATAYPRAHDDIIIGPHGPEATSGYDPQFNLGAYNTGDAWDDADSLIPVQSVGARSKEEKVKVRDVCEEVLRASSDFGRSFIALDMATIPVPFPAYLKMKGDAVATVEAMQRTCDAAGFNYGPLLEYERATQNRPNMLALFESRYSEQVSGAQRQAEILAGLEVTV